MRLLLVEDDSMIGEAVLDLLRAEQYAVDWARDGDAADTALRTQAYDLVLLDLGLPQRDGLTVLRDLRARKNRTPVLVATARDAVAQRIEGLDAGADDYVLKPFDVPELLSRLHAVLRRSARQASEEWALGALRLAPRRHEAWVDDEPLALSPREFRLLVELAREPGKVVAKNVLAQRLEPLGDALDAATLEVHVSNLRKKIGAERVVTVRGVGYRLQP